MLTVIVFGTVITGISVFIVSNTYIFKNNTRSADQINYDNL